ncbi:hypothetical protein B0H67DRAFT_650575 [Lasiosphaeris hirsuta]|uniref:Uncharacterized protein n=1 Tax=Lasiosphaeris hirsuta TaxID=260670 RepID=A0AA40DFF3_9PEZI|nr:hypothetical protein B0H67DRAFT_650575 [Lasiosphaeris hirsuta]
MGIVRMWQQEMDEAIQFLRRSAALVEAAFGKRGQYWDNLFMLACCFHQSGAAQTSLDTHLEILQAKLDLLGKHTKSTLLSMYAVGTVYASLGDTPTTISFLELCIETATASSWAGEALGRAQYSLSRLYKHHGVEEADHLERVSRATLERYADYVSDWVTGVQDPAILYDDLQPTDEVASRDRGCWSCYGLAGVERVGREVLGPWAARLSDT